MVFSEETDDHEDVLVVASVRLDDEEVKEKYGDHEPTKSELYQDLWADIDEINQKQPFFKRIKRLYIRDTDFEMNTSQKIIRYSKENRRHD